MIHSYLFLNLINELISQSTTKMGEGKRQRKPSLTSTKLNKQLLTTNKLTSSLKMNTSKYLSKTKQVFIIPIM
ncbi:hypothetical protein VCRA2128O310_40146 [Vibrio crassostreae]|nr:hypothetical protein VCRA2113O322_140028 [Vibrio crassostreae]CAK2048434.1 hypothetical protein VCRA2113O324_380018 [Vibrio crassostreae]CAK2064956.1 hypothetical protein VCRA2111O320_370018 [Vibrio crassostreae]CAK2580340.1 hypothetical protein VCRA2113O323_150105 [Vibrio crassostreae]CAK2917828.1 hypothetical protein VCRA2121O336_360018 [Vibrio crassostreae]